ncbi:MAG TPA: hypothetical protein VL307_04090 [Chitinophagaceae bacterium]|jgi:hypothetical protein|nr:hypothetical protein [Chitinophagaceae bacterium]
MFQKNKLSVALATGYLLVYCILLGFDALFPLAWMMLLLSPVMLFVLFYHIIKNAGFTGRELKEDEEFGYQDRQTSSLKTF